MNYLLDLSFVAACIFGPVAYASFAGRASANLIDTEIYHKWAFRFFLVAVLGLGAFWLARRPPIICADIDLKWHEEWLKHLNQYHRVSKGLNR